VKADLLVVLDACVLANQVVSDLLLRLAEHPRLYVPKWSEKILEETRNVLLNKLKRPWPPELVAFRDAEIRRVFPEAIVDYPESILSALTNDPKDRHVLAASIIARAQLIVTFDLAGFSDDALKPWAVEACSPDVFLLSRFGLDETLVIQRLNEISYDRRKPVAEILSKLQKRAPKFVESVVARLGI
jgi:predicted nucleic acid-binding protein